MLKTRLMNGVAFGPAFAPPDDDGAAPPAASVAPAGADAAPADDNAPPADADAPPAGADDNAPPTNADAAPAAAAPPVVTDDWRDKEIRRKHAQNLEQRRRNDELEAELATTRALLQRQPAAPAAAGDAPAAPAAPATLPVEAVQREAARLVAQQNINTAADNADATGLKNYGADKWKEATDRLELLGGFDPDTMTGILQAADDPAKVIFELGTNPAEYRRVMDLPPNKRLAEIVKLGMPAPAPRAKRPSDAPPPAEPVGSRPRPDVTELRDDLTDDEWYARRDAQRAAKAKAARPAAAR